MPLIRVFTGDDGYTFAEKTSEVGAGPMLIGRPRCRVVDGGVFPLRLLPGPEVDPEVVTLVGRDAMEVLYKLHSFDLIPTVICVAPLGCLREQSARGTRAEVNDGDVLGLVHRSTLAPNPYRIG
jgi:hypothetical protein